MKKFKLPLLFILLGFSTQVFPETSSFSDALKEGQAHLNFRYRNETVDQEGISNDANASSLKTQLNYKSTSYSDFQLFIEVDDVSYLGDDDFNNTRNSKSNYPVIADPDGTDINQLYLTFQADKTRFTLGRQKINRDNQRFIGGVGWRQNEQTYDAFSIINTSINGLTLSYDYLNKINRIFGPDNGPAAGSFDSKSHLINAKLKAGDKGSLVAYLYVMDFDNAATLSNQTIGLRYTNSIDMNAFNLPIQFEYAHQTDAGDNTNSYSSSYYLLEGGLHVYRHQFKVGYEVLGGSRTAGEQFQTPLATLHKFQGWSDKFLSTPTHGIEDLYLSLGTSWDKTTLTVIYHHFSAEDGSTGYGSEWDFTLSHKINANYSLLLKWAQFEADNRATDTKKLWLMLSATF